MTGPTHDDVLHAYENGRRRGAKAVLDAVSRVRFNAQSQHIHIADGEVRYDDVVYLRIDHLDAVLDQLNEATG